MSTRLLCSLFWFVLLACVPLRAAERDEAVWLAEIARIDALQDVVAAKTAMDALAKQLPAERSDELAQRWLSLRISVHQANHLQPEAAADIEAMLTLARERHLPSAKLEGLLNRALALSEAGQNQQALAQLRDALAELDAVPDPRLQYQAHNTAGILYSNVSDFENALSHYLRALPIAEQSGVQREERELLILNNLGSLYLNLRQPRQALTYVERGMVLATRRNNKRMQATLQLNRGYALAELGQHDAAESAYQTGLALARESNADITEITALVNLSDHALSQQDWQKAIDYSQQALALAEQHNDVTNAAIARANIGIALAGRGLLRQGLQQLQMALEVFQHTDNLATEDLVLVEIARITEQAGLHSDAIAALKRQLALREKMFASDRQRAITELQERFDATARKKQIELLERENLLQAADINNRRLQQWVGWLITLTVILAAIVATLSYRRVREINQRLKAANAQLEDQSIRDPLTGLLNRRSFQRAMERRWRERDRRSPGDNSIDGFVLLDIDYFKRINDGFGHSAGDAVLVEVAKRMNDIMRDSDMVLRWGGEEFLLYLRGSSTDALAQVVSRVLAALAAKPLLYEGKTITVSASAGFVPLPFAGLSEAEFGWERAVQLADLALYLGKIRGRNRAYGVLALHGNYAEVAPVLEQNLAQAIRHHLVTAIEVLGPGANPANDDA